MCLEEASHAAAGRWPKFSCLPVVRPHSILQGPRGGSHVVIRRPDALAQLAAQLGEGVPPRLLTLRHLAPQLRSGAGLQREQLLLQSFEHVQEARAARLQQRDLSLQGQSLLGGLGPQCLVGQGPQSGQVSCPVQGIDAHHQVGRQHLPVLIPRQVRVVAPRQPAVEGFEFSVVGGVRRGLGPRLRTFRVRGRARQFARPASVESACPADDVRPRGGVEQLGPALEMAHHAHRPLVSGVRFPQRSVHSGVEDGQRGAQRLDVQVQLGDGIAERLGLGPQLDQPRAQRRVGKHQQSGAGGRHGQRAA